MKLEKGIAIFLSIVLVFSSAILIIPNVKAQTTTVRIIPSLVEVYDNGVPF